MTVNKLLVVVGPTSSGKSELAVKLAKLFNGEIISADSRQIYKGMDLGTGKVTGKWQLLPFASHPELVEGSHIFGSFGLPHSGHSDYVYVYKSIPHHLIDIANPVRQYSVARFQRQAKKCIASILKRGKLPILCGGTMHWLDAVVYDQKLPNVKPNPKLRAELETQSTDRLFDKLKKLDPVRAKTIDGKNRRRLIRALEIILTTGKPVPPISYKLIAKSYDPYWLGINLPPAKLYKKIDQRLIQRLKAGMLDEILRLHSPQHNVVSQFIGSPQHNVVSRFIGSRKAGKLAHYGKGLSWKRLESFGLEYKYISLFLQKKISYEHMLTQLSFAIKHYSKRQMTWWKKNKEIHWIKNPARPPMANIKSWLKL